jgi:3'(2'), 5'-bisphosphate nucleotidase
MVVSRTRPAEAVAVSEQIGAELVPMGSAGQKRWRLCAARRKSIFTPAGNMNGTAARPQPLPPRTACTSAASMDRPLVYNQADTYMPDLLICRSEWAERVLKLVAERAA